DYCATTCDDQPALHALDLADSQGHILIVRASDHNVVRVVSDRGGHRAVPQAQAVQQADTYSASPVTLDDCDFEKVPVGGGHDIVFDGHNICDAVLGDDLIRDHADDTCCPARSGEA